MKNLVSLLFILAVITTIVFSDYIGVVRAASQSESTIPHSGDLCRGTGGNGQIVSIGNNTFTIKQYNGDSSIVNFTGQATIEISAGPTSLSY